jgi:glycosyltransferase involved in cell wall biosynthesis
VTVAVIITCCNEEAYIAQAVRSVIGQTDSASIAEIVIVDDGSKDGSRQVLARLAREDSRIRILHAHGVGLPAARNLAIGASSAPLIAFLDGDDYWRSDKLEQQLEVFVNPRVGLVYSDYVDFAQADLSDALLVNVRRFSSDTPHTLAEYFVHDGPIVPSTAIIARTIFEDVGLFDEQMRPGEDTEMFLRIAERWQFQHVPGGLTFKRRHGRQVTRQLERLLPMNLAMTERFVERNPGLRRLIGQRLSRRYARVGHDCAQHGQGLLAFTYLSRAVSYAPFFWRAYAYLALLMLPLPVRTRALRWGKRLFHGSLQRLRTTSFAR